MAEGIYRYCVQCRGGNFTPYPNCRECRNAGKKRKAKYVPCTSCGGERANCVICNGTGKLIQSPAGGLTQPPKQEVMSL